MILVFIMSTGPLSAVDGSPTRGGTSTIDYGPDGRLTVLLLGSDQRAGLPGERLDVILVASFDPATDRVAMASVPRDTVRFPRAASNGGGHSGSARVNTMFSSYSGSKHVRLDKFRNDVERALDMDIDFYAYLKFTAFDALVDEIDGLFVDTPGKIVDKTYMDEPTLPRGIRFPFGADYELRGQTTPNCESWKPAAADCHRAIVYVRSRKGTEGSRNNNDYRRSYRQHGVVMGAVDRVTGRDTVQLDSLVLAIGPHASAGTFATDIPHTYDDAMFLYDELTGASIGKNVVFAPSTYATASGATITLRLSAVRAWVDQKMTSVGPSP
jgi:anionic cell wall polymer biosynthesis LytR-Cps2A-Psr (LCP) family protein